MENLKFERIFMLILGGLMLFVLTLIFLILSGKLSGLEATAESQELEAVVEAPETETTVDVRHFGHEENYAIVRTGRERPYGRIVFDWREPVYFRERLSGDLLSISFFDTAPINVSHLHRQLHDFIVSASTRTYRNHIHVDLKLRRRIATAVSQWDDLVVVDMVELE